MSHSTNREEILREMGFVLWQNRADDARLLAANSAAQSDTLTGDSAADSGALKPRQDGQAARLAIQKMLDANTGTKAKKQPRQPEAVTLSEQVIAPMSPVPVNVAPAVPIVPSAITAAAEVTAPAVVDDWQALNAKVRACRACGLCEKRTQTVFGVGDIRASWLFIGEGPGANEDRQGEPFVGPAGQLLNSMLFALNLDREHGVYIANAVKCRPPNNRDPAEGEIAACSDWLQQQIELLAPRVIVLLGKVAARAVLHIDDSMFNLRGKVHSYCEVPVVVTFHPAYLLRSPMEKAKAWQDLLFAKKIHDENGGGRNKTTKLA